MLQRFWYFLLDHMKALLVPFTRNRALPRPRPTSPKMQLSDLPNELLLLILLWLPLTALLFRRFVSPLWTSVINYIFSRTNTLGLYHYPKYRSSAGFRRSMVRYIDSFDGTLPTPFAAHHQRNGINIAQTATFDCFIDPPQLLELPGLFTSLTQLILSGTVFKIVPHFCEHILNEWAHQLTSFTVLDLPVGFEIDLEMVNMSAELVGCINAMTSLEELRLFNCDGLDFDSLILSDRLERLTISNRWSRLMDVDRAVGQLGGSCRAIWLENVDIDASTFEGDQLDYSLTYLAIGRLYFAEDTLRRRLLGHIGQHFRLLTHLSVNFCWDFPLIDILPSLINLPALHHLTIPFNIPPLPRLSLLLPLLPILPTVHTLLITECILYPLPIQNFFTILQVTFPALRRIVLLNTNCRQHYSYHLCGEIRYRYSEGISADVHFAGLTIDLEKLR